VAAVRFGFRLLDSLFESLEVAGRDVLNH